MRGMRFSQGKTLTWTRNNHPYSGVSKKDVFDISTPDREESTAIYILEKLQKGAVFNNPKPGSLLRDDDVVPDEMRERMENDLRKRITRWERDEFIFQNLSTVLDGGELCHPMFHRADIGDISDESWDNFVEIYLSLPGSSLSEDGTCVIIPTTPRLALSLIGDLFTDNSFKITSHSIIESNVGFSRRLDGAIQG